MAFNLLTTNYPPQENNNFDILMEVSLDNMESLFLTLDSLSPRQNIADVVFHVIASMRDSLEALDRVSTARALGRRARFSGSAREGYG